MTERNALINAIQRPALTMASPNAEGKRERLSGPKKRKPANVSYAANFGGLIRMLKTNSKESQSLFRKIRKENSIANDYISFIHRNYQGEEASQYLIETWRELAANLGITLEPGMSKDEVITKIRNSNRDYMTALCTL